MKPIVSSLYSALRRKECPYTQFVKYVASGGVALAVDQVVFYFLAWMVFPSLRASDPVARLIVAAGLPFEEATGRVLQLNYWINKIICFVVSVLVVYVLNVVFVLLADRDLSLIRLKQGIRNYPEYGVRLDSSPATNGDHMFGVPIWKARDSKEYREALRKGLTSQGPVVVEAHIDGHEYDDLVHK